MQYEDRSIQSAWKINGLECNRAWLVQEYGFLFYIATDF